MIAGAGVTLAIWTAAVQVALRAGILSVISLQSVLTALIMMGMAVLIILLQWRALSLMMAAQVPWILLRQLAIRAAQRCRMSWVEAVEVGHAQQRVIQLVAWSVGSGILRIRIAVVRRGMCLM
ncbi:hypothetical protein AUJ69_04315 [Candidatus Woesearchaeota archaeon CG1_02_47_18]|nr:MAG: hypothetical protein AUJ69_04315 [Candidatus Woesearchaeota archaeon CG1_02_47_18]